VKELQHFNLYSVSQICNTKNKVFFSEDECLVLSKDFKLPEDTTILLNSQLKRIAGSLDAPKAKRPKTVEIVNSFGERELKSNHGVSTEGIQSAKPIVLSSIPTKEASERQSSMIADDPSIVVSSKASPSAVDTSIEPATIPSSASAEQEGAHISNYSATLVRKAEQEAAIAKQARYEIDKLYEMGVSVPISSVSTSSIRAEDASGASKKVIPSLSMGIYVPGRRGKMMSYMRHIALKRSVRLTRKQASGVSISHKGGSSKHLDLKADGQTFIKVGSSETFPEGSSSVLTKWTLTDGQLNTIYRIDTSYMKFTFLKDILHLVDKQDLITLNGLVTQYYATHTPQGSGLYLLGDLQVLFDSQSSNGIGYSIWKNSHKWMVDTWRFYPLPNVHVVETKCGIRVCMFSDQHYPLSIKLMKRMLRRKLEVPPNPVANDMTHAEQLIGLIKSKLL
jgi:hypothetical protein